jgi:hypothetical protein
LFKVSGYIDIDKINTAAWPALVADLGAGDQSITALSFGKLFYIIDLPGVDSGLSLKLFS